MLNDLIEGNNTVEEIENALVNIHSHGPVDASIFESLAYIKRYHPDTLHTYESRLIALMGLFYKSESPKSLLEEVYSIFSQTIQSDFGRNYTPLQASAHKEIDNKKYFSFSAPTSAGKSYLLRDIIKNYDNDIIIVVPSRALISEYYYEIIEAVPNDVLVLQFVEDIYKDLTQRRIYIVTPERATEIFKFTNQFNIGLILMDEAQISEEPIRGLKFDAFVRRSERAFPNAKKVFAHPFVLNPEAQLKKHSYDHDSSSRTYNLHTVGKIFVSHRRRAFSYFSPYKETNKVPFEGDLPLEILENGGTLLIYVSKSSIYSGKFITKFAQYIDHCTPLANEHAREIIEDLRKYVGASKEGHERHSTFVEMMERGIVVHHGSMPLKARLLIEKFIRSNHAKICFATSTLNQGINMPFDAVWIDYFSSMDQLTLKNLIGRAGRTVSKKPSFDYGYTIVNSHNVNTFSERIKLSVEIGEESTLDSDPTEVDEDLQDVVEAVRDETFNDEMHLPQSQIDRIFAGNISNDISNLLDNLINGDSLISGEQYYNLENYVRDGIKSSFKNIYIQHLKRKELTRAESGVLSAAIPIMLWHIQGKSFSEIVSLRYSFLSKRDERRYIIRLLRNQKITAAQATEKLREIHIKYSPAAFTLPQKSRSAAPLYAPGTSVLDIDYDKIVYDTYDYLDKVISLSLSDPVCAVFELYYLKTQDERARVMQNYIRFGTNSALEIWLLRYGIDPEDIEWLKKHIHRVDEHTIEFNDSILQEPISRLEVVERYI